MAGYFVVLGDLKDEEQRIIKSAKDILSELCQHGIYSTNLFVGEAIKKWSKPKVATFADYFGMKKDDYIFFFFGRKIYGVGKLVNIGEDCKYWSYKGANLPKAYTEEEIKDVRLVDDIKPENRCLCFFEPVSFYPYTIDMDEALTTYPDSFKSLRVIQGRSFIKLDDEEAMALFSVLNRRNDSLREGSCDWKPPKFDNTMHEIAKAKLKAAPEYYRFSIESLLLNYQTWSDDGIQEEMAIEAAVIDYLTKNNDCSVFDKLAYITHQVSASPAKPVEYMEWIDVFGYSVSDYLIEQAIPIQFSIDKYYVMEIKRGELSLPTPKCGKETNQMRESMAVANQLMKYVDWIAKNYASGNYPMVKGVLVANGFDESFIKYCEKMCVRNYNDGYRDATPAVWGSLDLIKYSFDGKSITFKKVFSRD